MFLNKYFILKKNLVKLIKIRFFFEIPKSKKIILLDQFGYDQKYKILPKNTYTIDIRNHNFNIFILLLSIIKLKFSKLHYIETYIEYINPKILITFLDNNELFYNISSKSITKIAVQNGRRLIKANNLFLKKNKTSNYIFTLSEIDKRFYQRLGINCKNYISHGSYRCNSQIISKKKLQVITDIIYVSTYRNFYKNKNYPVYKNITSYQYIKNELKLINYLSEYCKKYNKKISVLMRHPKYSNLSIEEQKFFIKHFNIDKLNLIYSKHYEENKFLSKSKNIPSSYNNLFKSRVVVGIDSTLLYEAFSLGCRVGFFSVRGSKNELKFRKFAWPYKFSEKGSFWSNILDKKIIFNILNNLFNYKKNQWFYNLKKYKYIMNRDNNNKKLKRILNKILIA